MKVYVVMGNDFPEAVFSSEEAAKTCCIEKKKVWGERVYWRVYAFELDQEFDRVKV